MSPGAKTDLFSKGVFLLRSLLKLIGKATRKHCTKGREEKRELGRTMRGENTQNNNNNGRLYNSVVKLHCNTSKIYEFTLVMVGTTRKIPSPSNCYSYGILM